MTVKPAKSNGKANAASPSASTDAAVDVGSPFVGPSRLLIAEDEPVLAENLTEQVGALGYDVIGPAATGPQAVSLARRDRPDLALLDIRMGANHDGIEAAGTLYKNMGIPVVIISAHADSEYLKSSERVGVFGYLMKPVTSDALRVGIVTAWGRFQHEQALKKKVSDLQTALEERKIIERAKGLIMKKLSLSEEDAMRRLHKQARDVRLKLADFARAILETQDLFDGSKK